ncbi:TIGR02281 family clan AA aspartic protease [Lutibaculum baratangense]|uniref:TIGR02281 family clan AA aspartic protease n=1 Tax=Lutibaculum baratangense AMV1 TaxID=631454 RepID=V4RN63_9HYPH|nr:TIGR02281 family clan AA aspartic protease [Lutibaculum baratangense]ESR26729.1 hypothetical protein N177_0513 [Lutibaculum baratangense AMV1]
MRWLWLILLLSGVAVAVPALEQATDPDGRTAAETASAVSTPPMRDVRIAADDRGHFGVRAVIAGRDFLMIADTGASVVVLTEADARRAGFNPASLAYDVPVSTANGTAYAAEVSIARMEVEHIVVRDVRALVAKPEALQRSLLGMTFLGRLREFSVKNGQLVLVD